MQYSSKTWIMMLRLFATRGKVSMNTLPIDRKRQKNTVISGLRHIMVNNFIMVNIWVGAKKSGSFPILPLRIYSMTCIRKVKVFVSNMTKEWRGEVGAVAMRAGSGGNSVILRYKKNMIEKSGPHLAHIFPMMHFRIFANWSVGGIDGIPGISHWPENWLKRASMPWSFFHSGSPKNSNSNPNPKL